MIYRLLKKPFFGRYQKPWRWPAQVPDAGWERVRIDSESGAKLHGLFARAHGPARGAVVCAHPMGVDAKGFFLKRGHAELLRDNGYDVLLFDFNGFGESPSGNFSYPLDVIAAGRKLQELSPGQPLGLMGASFGAAWSMCALARPDHPFQAAALECPFTTLDEYWIRYRIPYYTLKTLNVLLPRIAAELRPIVQIARLSPLQELLLIYGDRDDVTPAQMGQRFAAACSLPKEKVTLWTIPGAEHTKAFTHAPEEYRERVLALFARTLVKTAPAASA
ncbi:MAG: alpha/beta fold hydrolase [Deltaproteobacteria bacterium]|nr:alpha/beta fold hydrolase [Deltaproteobacteria bacterium]